MHARSPRSATRWQSDDGAVLAEFALALPFLMVIVIGVLEYGFLFRQTNTLAGVVQGGARSNASTAAQRKADEVALSNINAQVQSLKRATLTKVVVFKATSGNGVVPTACKTTSQTGLCNTYDASQVAAAGTAAGQFTVGCTGNAGSAWDHYWCPTDRAASLPGNPDWVGVYVEVSYTGFSGFFPTIPTKLSDTAVFREEVTL